MLELRPPVFDPNTAAGLARHYFGVIGTAAPLPSERDQNFKLTTSAGDSFVLKVTQAGEDRPLLEAQNTILALLETARTRFRFPRLRPALNGELMVEVVGSNGTTHQARLVEYLPGEPLARVRPQPPELLRSVGELLGTVDRVLNVFSRDVLQRDFYWDLRNGGTVIDRNLSAISDRARRARLASFQPLLEVVAGLDAELRRSVIHNDGNDYNLIVRTPSVTQPFEPLELVGLVDFGDVVHTWTVAEVAIAAAYVMLGKRDPLAAAAEVVAGYHNEFPLTAAEIEAVYPLICTRLVMSVALAAVQRANQPENEYLSISEAPAWALLERLAAVPP
ncbi:MAG TPA: phosphotransferase, partial [Longimicrobiales bacterium]|nr:phosphotransferase [Longimicrobiales bacterium]